jgi:hypothetical protein
LSLGASGTDQRCVGRKKNLELKLLAAFFSAFGNTRRRRLRTLDLRGARYCRLPSR